ncbi:MAG: AAA family ATPase [Desulfovibrionaceae bacterium]|nr:AAA family ATPase [Desulfovibrionaceae bacterium]
MITNISLKNFGPLDAVQWTELGSINLVLGENGQGKSFLLKAIYAAIKTAELAGRGDDKRTASEILADKLYWTFQTDSLGDLVKKPVTQALACSIGTKQGHFEFSFGQDTTRKVIATNTCPKTDRNSIFLPAREIISLQHIIFSSRDKDRVFGFDDTQYDLAQALRNGPTKGKNHSDIATSRQKLAGLLGGKIEYDTQKDRWNFKKGNTKFPMGITSEGIKKIAILDTLLGNRYLSTQSIIFVDEPESALHPQAINLFIDILALLARSGMQVFIASHSYFVIKKLFILAQKNKQSIPVLSLNKEETQYADMLNGMPKSTIIEESIRLYEEEIEVSL